ncbi:MAG: hypothetical protein AB1589_37100 [Cyanobacteriota bacterium]
MHQTHDTHTPPALSQVQAMPSGLAIANAHLYLSGQLRSCRVRSNLIKRSSSVDVVHPSVAASEDKLWGGAF